MSESNEETNNIRRTLPEMSPEEFKKILVNWYKNQGIATELRTHLRHQMVQTLKNTQLGRKITNIQPRLTPKTEVINLLISEFLLKYDYHYSLSIFSSEIPEGNVFQTNSRPMLNGSKKDFKFTEQYVWYILEMLEFKRDSMQTQMLHDLYFKNPKECLLVCIINILSSSLEDKVEKIVHEDENKEYFNNLEPGLKNMSNVLTHFQIPQGILIDIFEHIKELLKREKDRIKTEESMKYNTLQSQVEKEMYNREIEISQMVNEMENAFIKEKQLLFEDLKSEHDNVQLLKLKSQEKEREYHKKLVILNNKEQNMKQHEAEIEKQLQVLKLETNEIQRNAHTKKENKKIQTETEHLHKETSQSENITKCDISIATKEQENLLNISQLCKSLQLENSELKMKNREFEIRSGELTSNNLRLIKDLENAMATINILSTKMTSTPTKPITAYSNTQKLRFASQSTIYSDDRSSSSSDDNSTTDFILQEARQRLRKLEEETKAVDRNYKEFKQRHVQQNVRKPKTTAVSTSETSDINY